MDEGSSERLSSGDLQDNERMIMIPRTFPVQLYKLLQDASTQGFEDIVSWLPTGDGFKIHKKAEFEALVLSRYFRKQSKRKSFLRQLNLYGFHRVTSGTHRDCYVHKAFRRGNLASCKDLRRRESTTHGTVAAASGETGLQQEQGPPDRNLVSPGTCEADNQTVLSDDSTRMDVPQSLESIYAAPPQAEEETCNEARKRPMLLSHIFPTDIATEIIATFLR